MREPKYKLNPVDELRWRLLVTRECCELGKPDPQYPPLAPKERLELERLQRRRSRKIASHPKVKSEIRQTYRRIRKARRMMERVREALK